MDDETRALLFKPHEFKFRFHQRVIECALPVKMAPIGEPRLLKRIRSDGQIGFATSNVRIIVDGRVMATIRSITLCDGWLPLDNPIDMTRSTVEILGDNEKTGGRIFLSILEAEPV